MFDRLKEFVGEHEAAGNQVRLPKINEEIVLVRIKESHLI